jgi:hypothetical protein
MNDVQHLRIDSGAPIREPIALLIAALGGALAAAAGAAPTGTTSVDGVLVFLASGFVIWAGASTPWWLLAIASGCAAATAADPVLIAVGVVALAGSVAIGVREDLPVEARGVVAAVLVNVLIRSDLDGFFGLSSIVGMSTCVAVAAGGVWCRSRRIQIGVVAAGGIVIVGALVAVGLAGVAAARSSDDIADATDETRRAVDAMSDGELEEAAAAFDRAADMFGRSADRLGGAVVAPSNLVPVVAQHVDAARDLSVAAEIAVADAASALSELDTESLTLRAGSIDIDAVRSVAEPLERVQTAVSDLESEARRVRSPWLIEPVDDRINSLITEIDEDEPRLALAVDAARAAPGLFGGDETRRYLVLFTSPSEARGLGGFSGNYAEFTIDDGRITVTDFGRSSDIIEGLAEARADCSECPAEVVDHYGAYGFDSGTRGRADPLVWLNLTMPAHFPHVAESAAALYPQATGRSIDGVLVMDPYVLAELMRYTGPIAVPELDRTVAADDAVDFLLVEQYLLADEKDERVDALDTLGRQAVTRMLVASFPEPAELVERFGPLVEERRLLVWTADEREQELLDELGLLGALPELRGDEAGFAVAVTNAGGSKIDSFLDRSVETSVVCSDDGTRRLVVQVTLANDAPTTGLPEYVIGSEVGLDPGTSRLIVAFYGSTGDVSVVLDGTAVEVGSFREAGWFGHRHVVELRSGERVDYEVTYRLGPGSCDDDPVGWTQPLRR